MIGTIKELIPKMLNLPDEKKYELKEYREKRTDRQNALLWQLLTLCVEVQTGRKNREDIDNLYINMLEYTGAKVDYVLTIEEALERLKKEVRLAVPVGKVQERGKEFIKVKVVYGSSKLNTKEMGLLIDNVLDYANNLGLETDYWSNLLKGVKPNGKHNNK